MFTLSAGLLVGGFARSRLCSFFFLMIRRPPRSTLDRSSAASDVYKRQGLPEGAQAGRLVPKEHLEDEDVDVE